MNCTTRRLIRDEATTRRLAGYLAAVDDDFEPNLSCTRDLSAYADKVLANGVAIVAEEGGDWGGAILFYCNDLASGVGYIALLSVRQAYRGKGIAASLVREALEMSRQAGMKRMTLQCNPWNMAAMALYGGLGFRLRDKPVGAHVRDDSVFLEYLFDAKG